MIAVVGAGEQPVVAAAFSVSKLLAAASSADTANAVAVYSASTMPSPLER